VLVDEETGRVVGAHLLAMRTSVPASTLKELPVAYPASSSDVAYMA
jgi:hypothetical protein